MSKYSQKTEFTYNLITLSAANKTKRQKLSSRRPGAYADKTCENTIKKLLPYGN